MSISLALGHGTGHQSDCAAPAQHRLQVWDTVPEPVSPDQESGWDPYDVVREGYERYNQNPDLQADELRAAGCYRVFTDHASGAKAARPALGEVLDQLRPGDTLVVWRLDRLGRSLPHLIEAVTSLDARGVGFRSVRENIDTTSPGGRLVFYMFGALAEFERDLIQERTSAGLAAARARGRKGGRPTVMTPAKTAQARRMYDERTHTLDEIAKVVGVSRSAVARSIYGSTSANNR